jgi:hypothetical protein
MRLSTGVFSPTIRTDTVPRQRRMPVRLVHTIAAAIFAAFGV